MEVSSSVQVRTDGLIVDTGLTEQIMAVTATDEFNTALEVQQSASTVPLPLRLVLIAPVADLVAGVDFLVQENAIRDLINQEAPLRTILRLLCLYSIVTGGLKPKVLEEFKRDILQVRSPNSLSLSLSLPTY